MAEFLLLCSSWMVSVYDAQLWFVIFDSTVQTQICVSVVRYDYCYCGIFRSRMAKSLLFSFCDPMKWSTLLQSHDYSYPVKWPTLFQSCNYRYYYLIYHYIQYYNGHWLWYIEMYVWYYYYVYSCWHFCQCYICFYCFSYKSEFHMKLIIELSLVIIF